MTILARTRHRITSHKSLVSWLTLLFLSVIWGASFILIKKSLVAFSYTEVAGLRVTFAGLGCLPFFVHYFRRIPKDKIALVFMLGAFSAVIPAFLFSLAQTRIDSSVTGVLNTFSPIWTLLLGVLFFGVIRNQNLILGTALGFTGAVILVAHDGVHFDLSAVPFMLLVLLATLSYGLTGNLVKSFASDIKPVALSIVGYGFWTVPCILYLSTTDVYSDVMTHDHGLQSLIAVMFLGLFSTAICSFIFYWLIHRTNQVFASYVAYMMPIIALILGAADGEKITFFHIAGLVIIVCGLYISQLKRKLFSK